MYLSQLSFSATKNVARKSVDLPQLKQPTKMSGPDSIIVPQDEDLEASKELISPASATNGANGGSNEDPGCLIDAKPPDDIKHLIAKDESTLNKFVFILASTSKYSLDI